MTRLLDQAYRRAQTLPEERQDEFAEMFLKLLDHENPHLCLSEDQINETRRRKANLSAIATDAEVDALYRKLVG